MAPIETGQTMMNIDGVWVVIPAYNVLQYLAEVLLATSRFVPLSHIIVVDDGSSDGCGRIAAEAGAITISHPKNLGKGEALKSGFMRAVLEDAEWIVTIDGDMQHDPATLPDFLSLAGSGEVDLIIGKRKISGSKMPLDRRFSNRTSSMLLSIVVGQQLLDIQCGYRMVRVANLIGVECESSRYDFEIELLLRLIRRGARIGWVEISTRYQGEPSSIRRVGDTFRFLKWVIRYLFRRM